MQRKKHKAIELVRYRNYNLGTGEEYSGYFEKSNLRKVKYKYTKVYDMKQPYFSSPTYEGYLVRLLRYLEPETNKLTIRDTMGNRPVIKKDMQDIMGNNIDGKIKPISRQTVYVFLKEAENKNVVLYDKDTKAFYVNPQIAMKGAKVVDGVKEMFAINE